MPKLLQSQTMSNLARAWAGECQARVRYQFLEYAAKQNGLFTLAEVINTVEKNEFNHARMYYTKMQTASKKTLTDVEVCANYPFKEKWNFKENFLFAIENETNEIGLYRQFAKIAEEEGFGDIAQLFNMISQVEHCHKMLFTDISNQLENGTMYKREKAVKWKCSECGHEDTLTEAWQTCPICAQPQGKVMLILKNK